MHPDTKVREDISGIAFYEDQLYGDDTQEEESVQFIVFLLDDEWYAVEITGAQEIVPSPRIAYLPYAPAHIAGITNLRGNIISVTDLRTMFGMSPTAITDETSIIVIESQNLQTGILVDKVSDVTEISLSDIEPPLATLEEKKAAFIEGGFRCGNRFIGILKLDGLFGIK